MLSHLAQHGTCCVCVLQERVPVAANLLSYHLKVLRDAGLVSVERRGKEIYYTLQGEGINVGRPAVFCRFSGSLSTEYASWIWRNFASLPVS